MASGKEIRISIQSALNAAGIEATKSQVAAMASSVKKSLGDMATHNRRHWADIKAAWDMGLGAMKKAWSAFSTVMKSAFHFEAQTRQFKTLIGSMDEAKRHMADLKELGDTPPFSLDEFAKASRSLMVMTDGALGFKKSLKLVGDAAAATGHPVEEMGQAVGRLYAMIRDGQPLSRATVQLRNMGVITPEVAQKLQDLQAAGKSNAEIWAEVEAQLGRYKGAMSEAEKTGEGLMGAIKSRWDNIVRAVGHAFEDTAKDGMGEVLTAMDNLEQSGAIENWANATVAALGRVIQAAKTVGGWFDRIWDHLMEGREAWKEMGQEAAAASGEAESFEFEREEAVNAYTRKKYYKGSQGSERVEVIEDMAAKKRYERELREQERLAKEKEREEREAARIAESLAAGQKKTDERNAKAAAEKAAKEREHLEAREAARREREITRLHNRRLALLRKEYSERERLASEAQRWESEAESKLQQAWGWYRDKGSMAAQLKEERENAKAEKQFNEDFLRLQKNHKNWRNAKNLSIDEEAVRRVALAFEEKEQASQYAAATADSAARAANALEYLQKVFENAGGR